jgi:hypothetical protein
VARTSSKMISHPGKATSVKVVAHERKRPARNMVGLAKTTAQHTSEEIADNAFRSGSREFDEQDAPAITGGLSGEPKVNHLKAAVGLLNRRRHV